MLTPQIQKRIIKELKELNSDFFNLRTVISPDPNNDVSKFYFIMLPNDGAASHLPIVGSMYIPQTYPSSPPVIHVYTKTGRYNVDVYNCYRNDRSHSTLCFDILRNKMEGGKWEPHYSISTLFASLMSAIVSFYVPQEYGMDQAEYVTMEKLASIKKESSNAYRHFKQFLPIIPQVPLIEAKAVPAIEMSLPDQMHIARGSETFSFGPIYLQEDSSDVYTVALDLSGLHDGIVFSVVLSNSKTDLTGKRGDTILVRNGVTATAARKVKNYSTKWFYHGKPMNDGDMVLHISVGLDQMTFAYNADGKKVIHGDCAVSRLTDIQIGDVKKIPFFVNIFLKRKFGNPVTIKKIAANTTGYLHDVLADLPIVGDFQFPELFDTAEITKKLDNHHIDTKPDAIMVENEQHGETTESQPSTNSAQKETSWRNILFGK